MNKRRLRIVHLIFTTILVITLIIRFYLLGDLSTKGIDLATIQQETREIKNENITLKAEILRHESLNHIENEARKEGFVEAIYYYLH